MTESHFLDEKHKIRFKSLIKSDKYNLENDVYWSSALFLLTADQNTENHMHEIMNIEERELYLVDVLTQGAGWLTSTDYVLLAFAANYYNDFKGFGMDGDNAFDMPNVSDAAALPFELRWAVFLAGEIRNGSLKAAELT